MGSIRGKTALSPNVQLHLARWITWRITARTFRGITIDRCTPLHGLSARTSTLCLPCPYAEATCTVSSPNARAAGCAEMAGAAGP